MNKYVLHYFGGNGRAAIARAILSYSKTPFENDMIAMENWGKIKTSNLCEYQQLPILEHNGKKFSQSIAIDLYLARQFNWYGSNADEQYIIDSLLCTFDDLFSVGIKLIFPSNDDEKNHPEKVTAALTEKLKWYASMFEKRYVDLGKKKYFLGDKFTLADIYLTVALSIFRLMLKGNCPCKDVAPNIVALITRVKDKELKEYFEKYFVAQAPF